MPFSAPFEKSTVALLEEKRENGLTLGSGTPVSSSCSSDGALGDSRSGGRSGGYGVVSCRDGSLLDDDLLALLAANVLEVEGASEGAEETRVVVLSLGEKLAEALKNIPLNCFLGVLCEISHVNV